jgi:lysophospholipase L1-like esterase
LYLQNYVLPLNPDIVLINYCENDILPTEDPFKNARAIHIQYLNELLERPDLVFTPEEKAGIQKLIHIFGSAKYVWNTMGALHTREPNLFHLATKVFNEIPVTQMAEVSRESGVRLIYVFIPPRSDRTEYAYVADKLQKLLVQRGAEFLNLQSALVPNKNELTRPKWMFPGLGWLWPRELKEILILRSMRTVHNRDIYFDSLHPTKKGNAIIAEHIYHYLTETSTVKATDIPK